MIAPLLRPLVVAAACALALGACNSKKQKAPPPPQVTGLAAVPASAETVVGIDVAKLANSDLVQRAVGELLAREPQLRESWTHVRDACKVDLVKQVRRIMVAQGPTPQGGRPGTGPAILVAVGAVSETDLATCVRAFVGKGGGTLTAKTVDGRTLYQARDGNRTFFFAFGRADTVVLGNHEAYVLEALGPGKKVLANPTLSGWIKKADQHAPLWFAGSIVQVVSNRLVPLAKLDAGPSAIIGSVDPTDGLDVVLAAVMASAKDAKQLESLAKREMGLFTGVAQGMSLGKVVQKVQISVEGTSLMLRADLAMDDVNHLLSVLDGGRAPEQGSPPPPK